MKENMVFCVECRKDVYYTVSEEKMTGTLKGETYEYMGRIAHCNECGNETYVPEVNDSNLKALYGVYRERNGIISLERILEIPEKYGIGKRPLSLLLGWGEQTFTRYCDGDMPTKQYAEILQRVYEDPYYYNSLLDEHKSNITTTAFEKSKNTIETILDCKNQRELTITSVTDYLINQCEDITHLTLQKALYYIQGFYYAFHNVFLFSNDCEAWIHGPVYKEVYSKYSEYRFDPIKKMDNMDSSIFSSNEKMLFDSVIKNLCCYSGKVLESFTHSETPWLETRGDLPSYITSNRVIEKELIGNYFCRVKEKFDMITPADIKTYSQNMFNKI